MPDFSDLAFPQDLLRSLSTTTETDAATLARQWQAGLDAIGAVKPTTPTEAVLAAHLVAAHNAALEYLRQAMCHDQGETRRIRLRNRAAAMMRSFRTTVLALQRIRARQDGSGQDGSGQDDSGTGQPHAR